MSVTTETVVARVDADQLPPQDDHTATADEKFHHATVIHDDRITEADLNKEVKISVGRNREARRWNLPAEPHRRLIDFVETITKHAEGQKDGVSFLQGFTPSGERKSAAMTEMYLAALDIDCGAPLQPVIDRIAELGLLAVVYTTHSHMTTESEINESKFIEFARKHGLPNDPPDGAGLPRFMRDVLHYAPAIADTAEYAGVSAANILVQHAPMPKYRIIFPLADTFVFADQRREIDGKPQKMTQREAHNRWRDRLIGLAKMIGVPLDRSCTDPARLFYLPRHRKGDTQWGITLIGGKLLDLTTVPEIGKADGTDNAADAYERAAADARDNGSPGEFTLASGLNLRTWAAQHGAGFQIVQLFEDNGLIRAPMTTDKATVACPFDDEHTTPGDEADRGTFICNGGSEDTGGKGFAFKCSHNHCHARDRLHMLKKAIENGCFEESVLTDDSYVNAIIPEGAGSAPASDDGADDPYSFDDADKLTAAFNPMLGVVTVGDKVRILHQHGKQFELLTKTDAGILFEPYNLVVTEKKKPGGRKNKTVEESTKAFDVWLSSPDRRSFPNGLVFEPGRTTDGINFHPIVNIEGAFNTWKGFTDEPTAGDWSLMQHHLQHVICRDDPEHYRWLMSWMAQLVQEPGRKIGTSVILHSVEEGTGKSTVGRWLCAMLGEHATKVSQERHVVGQFNAHMGKSVLLFCEEAFWAGSKSGEGVLKDLVTGDTLMLEHKGIDAVPVRNHMRLLICSNKPWVVPAGLNARRFFVLSVSPEHARDRTYFEALEQEMQAGGPAAMLYDLLQWDWKQVDLYNPPETEGLSEQKEQSLSPAMTWWLDVLTTGEFELPNDMTADCSDAGNNPIPNSKDNPDAVDYWQENTISLAMRDVHASLVHHTDRAGARPLSQNQMRAFLESVVPRLADYKPKGQSRRWVFPPLSTLKHHMHNTTGMEQWIANDPYMRAARDTRH